MKKLKLNKEKISRLTNKELNSLQGGGTVKSTNVGFTCCWCTNDTQTYDGTACPQSTYGPDPQLCPPKQ